MPAWRTGSEGQEVLYNMEGFLEEVTLSFTLRNKTIVIRGEGDVGAGKAFRAAGDTDTLVPAPLKTGARRSSLVAACGLTVWVPCPSTGPADWDPMLQMAAESPQKMDWARSFLVGNPANL